MTVSIRKPKLKISVYWFFIIFLIPAFLTYRSDLSILYDAWHLSQIPIAIVCIIYYIIKYKATNKTINSIIIYYIIAIASCYFNGYTANTIKWDITADVGIVLLAFMFLNRNSKAFLNWLSHVFFVYLLINTVTVIVFPSGIALGRIGQTIWFLGGKNVILPWILIGGGFMILNSFERFGKITKTTYLQLAICSLQAFLCGSSTAILIIVFYWLLLLFNAVVKNDKIMGYLIGGKRIFIIVAVIFTFITFFTGQLYTLQSFSEKLGKDITFNGRTAIWPIALAYIKSRPLIGMGPVLIFDMGWGVDMTHAHSLYLNVCAHYGIISLLCLAFGIWNVLKNARRIPIQVIFSLFLYLIGAIVEVYSLNTLFLFCVVLSYFGDNFSIVKQCEKVYLNC
ncbi:O-antigen ligase family protein [Oscillospiraceae bacterium HV4-5-C5C]|nr:O-antigen ligase family protein [Oscillospiraceae bacterium HV4-5-C5C]